MKVLVGGFVAESNARVQEFCELKSFMLKTGDEVAKALYVDDLFEAEGIEVIPAIYADGRAGGIVASDAFEYIANRFIKAVKEHQYEIDGMFFFLHGASNVQDLNGGSGEHAIIREIRKIVGPYMPIAMVMDPHGNLSQEQADNCNIIRTFRHSPHTDRRECHRLVAHLLIDLLKNRRNIHPVYRKVPVLLGGERTVSTDEPMVSINKLLDEIESDNRIMCCSYHIGYVRHDSDKCGASVIVVPNSEKDREYAEMMADRIADFAFSKRHEFHFTGTALEPEEAVDAMMKVEGGPCFISDSGDNCTAGGPGCNTFVLNQFMQLKNFNKKRILFACICDEINARMLDEHEINDAVSFDLGAELDALSAKVHIDGKILAKGELHHHYGDTTSIGRCVTVRLKDKPIDIVVAEKAVSFAEQAQYDYAGIDMNYDVIIVKQGYLYPELKKIAESFVMSLTDGATNQRTEKIKYQKILRPMYPIDEI